MNTSDVNRQDAANNRSPLLARVDVWAGLLFCAVALFGLWVSRDYPVGTAVRMGTGYFPRLVCWILLALGVSVLASGVLRIHDRIEGLDNLRPLIAIPSALLVFALTVQDLGVIIAGALLIGIGSLARGEHRPVETLICAIVAVSTVWAIFVVGLSLPIPVWPGG